MTADVQQLVSTVGRWAARGALTLAGVTFFIQWLLPRLRKWYRQHVLQEKPPDPAANPPGIYIYRWTDPVLTLPVNATPVKSAFSQID